VGRGEWSRLWNRLGSWQVCWGRNRKFGWHQDWHQSGVSRCNGWLRNGIQGWLLSWRGHGLLGRHRGWHGSWLEMRVQRGVWRWCRGGRWHQNWRRGGGSGRNSRVGQRPRGWLLRWRDKRRLMCRLFNWRSRWFEDWPQRWG
jgi:hypothetical protein